MRGETARSWRQAAWEKSRAQHWVISRAQLLRLGATGKAIEQRIKRGRLHTLFRGVYAVGRPDPGRLGWLMAATLAAGPGAFVSHRSAASMWTPSTHPPSLPIHVSVPGSGGVRRRKNLVVHHRGPELLAALHTRTYRGIPVTGPGETIVDIALGLDIDVLDATISEADKRDHIDPVRLRALAVANPRRPGAGRVRSALDRHTFVLSDSALERLFLPLALEAGCGKPVTRSFRNSHRVDFWFEDLGLIVETDGLRYHRTAAQQSRDLRRDQDHASAGQERLRFSHWQVKHEQERVVSVLRAVAARLRAGASSRPPGTAPHRQPDSFRDPGPIGRSASRFVSRNE